jgi:hypothetical protein
MAFNNPNILQLGSRIPQTPKTYTRPIDWISITGVSSGQIIFLVSDAINTKYSITFTKSGAGNVYVDWGDSTSDTYAASSTAVHTFTSGGTSCSRGYNTWKITMTKDVGTTITAAQITVNSDNQSGTPSGLLEAWYGDGTITTANAYFNTRFFLLEYVKLPETSITASNAFQSTFQNCYSLAKVTMPTSAAAITSLSQTFYNCSSLLEVTFPSNMTALTDMNSTFYQCFDLEKIVLPSTLSGLTTIANTFQGCTSLSFIDLPALTNCVTWTAAFADCQALTSLEIKSLKASSTHNFTSAFQSCTNLSYVKWPSTVTSVTLNLASAFLNCGSLLTTNFPSNANVSSYAAAFQNCYNLTSVLLPTNASSCTAMNAMFFECRALRTITLPSTAPSGNISFASAFYNCQAIDNITIPSGYSFTSLSESFRNCYNLETLTFNGAMNSCTTMSQMCDNCRNLQTVTLPTSLNACTTMFGAFQQAYSLKGPVVYPTTMSVLDTIQNVHYDNYSLISVTYPTSIRGNNSNCFNQPHTRNYSLVSVVMPATITNNTVPTFYGYMFYDSRNLKTITLPTSQSTGLSGSQAIENMFFNNYSLTTINNTDKIGNNSTGSTTYLDASLMFSGARQVDSLNFSMKFSKFICNGTDTTANQSRLTSLRMTNTGSGQWGGSSPQIDISYTRMSTAALNTFFADIAAQGSVTSKTINITSATGAAGLSAGDRAVLTSIGWTITG